MIRLYLSSAKISVSKREPRYHQTKARTMNTTHYEECLDLLWHEYPGNESQAAIYKYIADCKDGKYGRQMAKIALIDP